MAIHRLGARSLIRFLERDERVDGADKDALKARVVELSKQCGVSSSHTAFIAVHKGNKQAVKGPLVKRRIPSPIMLGCSMSLCSNLAPSTYSRRKDFMDIECGTIFYEKGLNRKAAARNSAPSKSFSTKLKGFFSSSKRENVYPTVVRGSPGCFETQTYNSIGCRRSDNNRETKKTQKDPLMQLISLQKASGCWEIGSTLAEVFGQTEKELIEKIPAQVKPDVWATLLALIWLHGIKINAQVEWQFLAAKAVSWIRSQKVVNQSECIQAGNSLLGCQVTKDALGL
ncbi:von Willebrand factor A domain-containing protein 5A-like isoform X2 [Tachysurus fulvidraco]|uniref:von Willebrand factor A domain-containing protein 5A-like isoform X2 n=1 Tax=Tachysurus fulvidraco TaxID=1234273 RepID=UPI001FEF7343|nr:von Willebrand factor A domain-containing protein 5A-like isoform X2 [Tachysurus fulvidraco]